MLLFWEKPNFFFHCKNKSPNLKKPAMWSHVTQIQTELLPPPNLRESQFSTRHTHKHTRKKIDLCLRCSDVWRAALGVSRSRVQ